MRTPIKEKLVNLFFLLILFVFINAFNFQDNPSGWYQQFLPSIGGTVINDMQFLDSLNGYIVTSVNTNPDSSYILKTTNGGDNWNVVLNKRPARFSRIKFINNITGFVSGGTGSGTPYIYKTTDAGNNWFLQSSFGCSFWNDMFVLNGDTIWVVDQTSLCGGVFRTTNGGANWTQQLSLGSNNPTHIYFYNKDIGFTAGGVLYKTTNSGVNWFNTNQTGFGQMQFINETTGYKCYGPMQKTTDGGLNWITLPLPQKQGNILLSRVNKFHMLNKDTIWGVGSVTTGSKGLIYLTTDGGQTWGYQLPSPSFNIFQYTQIQFSDKLHGWSYAPQKGVHTLTGGNDSTIIVSVNPIFSEIPTDFKLEQNYPNPFNPVTNFKFQVSSSNYVSIKVYDLTGKEIAVLVNEKKNAGSYSVSFDASKYNLSSGIYFYSLYLDNKLTDTKKMIYLA